MCTSKTRWRQITQLAAIVVAGTLSSACVTFPTAEERVTNALQQDDAFVFFGVEEDMPEKTFEMRPGQTPERSDIIRTALHNVETGEDYHLATAIDGPGDVESWLGALVPPGTYYLKLVPPRGRAAYLRDWDWRDNRYLVQVPEGGKSYYVGHFRPVCTAKKLLFGQFAVGQCESSIQHRMDTDRAKQAMRGWATQPAVVPAAIAKINAPALQSARAAVQGATLQVDGPVATMSDPLWYRFDNRTKVDPRQFMGEKFALLMYPSTGFDCAGGGLGCLGIAAIAGTAMLAVGVARSVDGAVERSQWSDCFDDLRDRASAFPLAGTVSQHWPIDHEHRDVEESADLQLHFYRFELRKCGNAEQVCAEIAMRARLDAGESSPLFERLYIYTATEFVDTGPHLPFSSVPAHAWWETAVAGRSQPRDAHLMCNSPDELTAELGKGVSALLADLLADLGN